MKNSTRNDRKKEIMETKHSNINDKSWISVKNDADKNTNVKVSKARSKGSKDKGKYFVDEKDKVRLEEFLLHLVDPWREGPMNEHWEKYYRLCQPCSVHYDFIGSYDNLEEDAQHVLQAVHADRVVSFPRRSATYKHAQTSAIVSDAYKDIPRSVLRRVYNSYINDFELFNLKPPEELWKRINTG